MEVIWKQDAQVICKKKKINEEEYEEEENCVIW